MDPCKWYLYLSIMTTYKFLEHSTFVNLIIFSNHKENVNYIHVDLVMESNWIVIKLKPQMNEINEGGEMYL